MNRQRIPRELNKSIKVTDEKLKEIHTLRGQFMSLRNIARTTGLGYTTIQRYFQSPEQKEREKDYKAEYQKNYRPTYAERNREWILEKQRERRQRRKIIFGKQETEYNSIQQVKRKYKNLSKLKLLDIYLFHKQKTDILLEIDPLLILFK